MIEMKNGYENVISKERKKSELSDNNINNINEENLSEHKKIVKQITKLKKDIEVANKSLLHNVIYLFFILQYQLLDKKKYKLEKEEHEKDLIEKEYKALNNMIKLEKRKMLKNLSEKLKLSVKFVTTSKF